MSTTEEPDGCVLHLRCEGHDETHRQHILQFLEVKNGGPHSRLTKTRCLECDVVNELRLVVRDRDCSECGHETVHVRKRSITGVVRGLFQYNTDWYCSVCGTRWTRE